MKVIFGIIVFIVLLLECGSMILGGDGKLK